MTVEDEGNHDQSEQHDDSSRSFHMQPLSWIRAILKQKLCLVLVWAACATAAILIVYSLPPVYKSGVLILVEGQRIPKDFVAPTVDTDLAQRLGALKQQVLSYPRLVEIVNKFNLYARQRRTHVEEQIVDMMRRDIDVELVNSGAQERLNAFRISYLGPSPAIASAVANQLGTLFIQENFRARGIQADGTAAFLKNQLDEAQKRLEEQETKLSIYKLRHNGQLPEQENALLNKLNQLQVQLQGVQEASNRAQQNKIVIDATLKSAQDSLALITNLAQRAPNDVNDPSDPFGTGPVKLSDKLEAELMQLEKIYTNRYPEVIQKRELLEAVRQKEATEEQRLEKATQANAESRQSAKRERMSPVASQALAREREKIEQLRAEETVINKQIAEYERERQQILQALASLRSSVDQLPVREQEMASITRDYQISKANYQSLLDKKLAAEMAGEMERGQKAERFTILEPARKPELPFKPNRHLLSIVGFLVALVIAAAVAVGRELRRDVLLGEWELPENLILARLPRVELTGQEHVPRIHLPIVVSLIVVALCGACAGALYYTKGWF